MAELKGSKTEKNLAAAFAGESQAKNKYSFFAKIARNEGYQYLANIFEETALHETQHAKELFKLLGGLGDTRANLQAAISGEDYETISMYPEFAKVAEEEGLKEVAHLFRQIAKVEAHHRDRYKKLLDMLDKQSLYKREQKTTWTCEKCGFSTEGHEPPPTCPLCKHPTEYFTPSQF
jgi:rubrerythrin